MTPAPAARRDGLTTSHWPRGPLDREESTSPCLAAPRLARLQQPPRCLSELERAKETLQGIMSMSPGCRALIHDYPRLLAQAQEEVEAASAHCAE